MIRTRTTRERATLIGLAVVLVALPLLRGGRDAVALPIALGLLSIMLIFLSVEGRLVASSRDAAWWKHPFAWIMFLLALVAAGLFFSVNRFATASGLLELLGLAGFFFLGTRLRHEERALSWMMIASAALITLIGFGRFFDATAFRIGSTFENANAFAGFLVLPLFLAFARAKTSARRLTRWVADIACGIIAVGFILTFSITAWVAIAFGLAVWWILVGRPLPSRRTAFIGCASVCILIIALIGLRWIRSGSLSQAVSLKETLTVAAGESSLNQRMRFLSATGKMFLERPAIGGGYNTWAVLHPMFQASPLEKPLYAHSWYAQTIAETGVLGAAVLLGIVLTMGMTIRRQRQRKPWSTADAGLVAGITAAAIHGGIDFAWNFFAVGASVALFAGLACAGEEHSESDRQFRTTSGWERGMSAAGILGVFFSALLSLALFYGRSLQTAAGQRLATGDTKTALAWFEQSFSFAPDPNMRRDAANLLFQTAANPDEKERARQMAERAARDDPYDAYARNLLGRMALDRGDLKTAETEFRNALTSDPINNPPFALDLAFLLGQQGRWKEIESVLTAFLDRYTKDRPGLNPLLPRQLAEMNQFLGQAALRENKTESAKQFFQAALKEDPAFPLTDEERNVLGG